jgi:hypothetical protein
MTFYVKNSFNYKYYFFIFFILFTSHIQAKETSKITPFEKFILSSSISEFKLGSGVIFTEQNPSKVKIIRSILSKFIFSEKIIIDDTSKIPVHYLFLKDNILKPQIEFRKINPAKYRIRIHGARGNFPIILSERFHSSWKAYLVPWKNNSIRLLNDSTVGFLSEYQALKGNEDNQANSEELKDFLSHGWVSDLKNKQTDEITLNTLITRLENIQSPQKTRKTDFISKNYFGSIQNNNLPANSIWETWFPRDIILFCSASQKVKKNCNPTFSTSSINKWHFNALQWPDLLHWQINSFANSWWIDTNFIKQIPISPDISSQYYKLNQNGSVDFEIVLEFWPQRLFYIGGIFSITLFLSCVIALVLRSLYRFINKRLISQHHSSIK